MNNSMKSIEDLQNRFKLVQVAATQIEADKILSALGKTWMQKPGVRGCTLLERRPNGNFVAGLGLYQLALRVTREPALPRLARPLLEELTAETGESSYLAVRVDDATGMYVAQASSSRRIREVSWLGEQIDLTDTALGAALSGRIDADGGAVRVGGVDDDVSAIVAPVRDASEHVVGAISLLGPTYRLTTDIVATWRPAVADTADRLAGG